MGRIKFHQEGALLVEMAFVMPIFALIFLAIIDGGLAIREHQILQNAAREATRFASLPPGATDNVIRQKVVDYCMEEKIPIDAAADVTIAPYDIPLGGGLYADGKIVTVSHSRQMLILGAPLLPSSSIRLTGRSVFRNLF